MGRDVWESEMVKYCLKGNVDSLSGSEEVK